MGPRQIREIRNPRALVVPSLRSCTTSVPRVSDFAYLPRTHRITYIYYTCQISIYNIQLKIVLYMITCYTVVHIQTRHCTGIETTYLLHHNVNTLLVHIQLHNICMHVQNYMYVYNTVIAASAMLHLYMYLHTLHVTEVSFTWTGRLHRGHGEISVYRPVATVFIHKYWESLNIPIYLRLLHVKAIQ